MLKHIRESLASFSSFDEIEIDAEHFESRATDVLNGKVFHVTAAHYLPDIVSSGSILPNSDGQRPSLFPQSQNSYGVKRGFICLFDFRAGNPEMIREAFDHFLHSAVRKLAHRPTFLILEEAS